MTTLAEKQAADEKWKRFACVSRAEAAIYFYRDPGVTIAAAIAPNYFSSKNQSGSVRVGDIIFVNAGAGAASKFAILKVDVVDTKVGTITTSVVFQQT
jgi:hypothetical protein